MAPRPKRMEEGQQPQARQAFADLRPFSEWVEGGNSGNKAPDHVKYPNNETNFGRERVVIDKTEFIQFCVSRGVSEKTAEAAFAPIAKEIERSSSARAQWAKAAKPERVIQPGWPPETYVEAHRAHGWNIVEFLEQRYADLIGRCEVTRVKLRAHDPSADRAISNYLHAGRSFPYCLKIPTKKELNDQALAANLIPRESAARLAQAAWRRKARNQ